jgi:hypothetical protein
MFQDLCQQRRKLRRNLCVEVDVQGEAKAQSLLDLRTGVSERASIIGSNLRLRSEHRLALNADERSTIYEQGLADAERVRSEATIEVCQIVKVYLTPAISQVQRYTRAEHLLHDPALLRLGDLDRERRIYSEAAAVIRDVGLMSDLDDEVASRVLRDIPPRSPRTQADAAATAAWIALQSKAAKRLDFELGFFELD